MRVLSAENVQSRHTFVPIMHINNSAIQTSNRIRNSDGQSCPRTYCPEDYAVRGTGVRIWHAALLLAAHIVSNPSIVVGRRVLELGCGAGAAPAAAAALAGAKTVFATDGEPTVLPLADNNLDRTLDSTARTRVRTAVLRWGNTATSYTADPPHPAAAASSPANTELPAHL